VLYASTYAALTRHLYGDLDTLTAEEKTEWAAYINGYQTEDGLFRDPAVANDIAETEDWWGWRHMTLHTSMALTALGAVASQPFVFLEPLLDPDQLTSWLESREWDTRPDFVSNEVQNFGTLLQYARDFHDDKRAGHAVETLLDWLDAKQDPSTGFWGPSDGSPEHISRGVQTGYHLWLLFFYDKRTPRYVEHIIDNALATQNRLGGFGLQPNSSACDDIDSIDPLVRLSLGTDYRRTDVRSALERALPWVIANMNKDGGFVFRRQVPLEYGHPHMSSQTDESAAFPTWFRTLSLGFLAQALPDSVLNDVSWQFVDSPGLQFWTR